MFSDRRAAGRRLGEALVSRPDSLILGIPRGGVIVAREAAEACGGELDAFVTRKLGAPSNPELGKLVVAKIQAVDGITRTLTCPVVHL